MRWPAPSVLRVVARSKGVRAGFSLKPGTPIEPYLADLRFFDLVLVMSVEPGFGGQSFMPDQLEKGRTLREAIDNNRLTTLTELLNDNPDPTEADIRVAISGNLCRCTGYHNIVAATLDAAKRIRAEGRS